MRQDAERPVTKSLFTFEAVSNAVFGLTILGATWGEVGWLAYGVIGFVWLMLGMYLMAALSPRRRVGSNLPQWATRLFDVFVLGHFIYFEWYWTAAAYALSSALLELVSQPAARE